VKFRRTKSGIDLRWLRSWFALTPQERRYLAGVLAIAVVGLAARYIHLRTEKPEPYHGEGAAAVK